MSLKSAHIAQGPYLYPAGNTPAVCLTDTVPPEVDANILLLGCGDIRNVLFTIYSGSGSDSRKLDFTCCDIEAEIVARNAVALTLISDDKDGANLQHIWSLYYHVFVDPQSMDLLRAHVQSLLANASSLETWSKSSYASLVRFCDDTTFQAVVKIWKLYAIGPSSAKEYKATQALLKDQWKAAQRHQSDKVADGVVLDGLRAAAPMVSEAFTDVGKQYRAFWSTGTCLDDKKLNSKFTVANPLFGCLRNNLILHYGMSPLTGFHLAPAYTQLAVGSPLMPTVAKELWPSSVSSSLQAALEQFSAWCNAFRNRIDTVTVRFVNADALAFCHVLQHHQKNGQTKDVHWYRNTWTFEPLILDPTEYAKHLAPASFNVVDTSNLMDHLGSLNVLTAAGPLLDRCPISTLRTEMLLPREANLADSVKKLLCGDLSTVALLLGLKPIQYWTNATNTWNINEGSTRNIPGGDEVFCAMSRPIVLWKPLDLSHVQYDAKELARFLYNIYKEMFSDESLAECFSILGLRNKNFMQKKLHTHGVYTRASLAALLRCIKNSNVVDCPRLVRKLVAGLIFNDESLTMGPYHFQSLCVHLEMLSVIRVDQIFDWWHPSSFLQDLKGPFRTWQYIPSIVCVTLVVPRKTVLMFSDVNKGNGTPVCQIQTQSSLSGKQSNYPDIQMGFGTITTSGRAFNNEYRVVVTTDAEGWKGKSPLIVSAMVSTCSMVEYGDTAGRVKFALKNTPMAMAKFSSKFGMFLNLHESNVGQKDVFVTQQAPNMAGHMSVSSMTAPQLSPNGIANVTITPALTPTHVASCQIRYDITSEDAKRLLRDDAAVVVKQSGLFELKLDMGSQMEQRLKVPFALKSTVSKTKISRKGLWVDFTAPIADLQSLAAQPNAIFPMNVCEGATSLDHLAYVDPDTLPKLRLDKASWLIAHTCCPATMSGSEYQEYEKARVDSNLPMPGRLGVKESLHCVYMHMTGQRGLQKTNSFCLTSPSGVVSIIVVDCIRMDLSHQTVFLDAALLPPQADSGSAYLTQLATALPRLACINVNDDETSVWKHLLPAFAERCRQWTHKDTCEYQVTGCVPISMETNELFMCSCGAGVFPNDYLKSTKPFEQVSHLAVRVAIPVIFSSPISQDDDGAVAAHASDLRPHGERPSDVSVENSKPKKAGCLKCNAPTTKAGNPLLKCAKCKVAQYCSPDCQKKDWKKHKQTCNSVPSNVAGDDAA
ncbi:hypothetical protein M3J09_013731 [Ascochyta lentis]